jgi:hypothetical protein
VGVALPLNASSFGEQSGRSKTIRGPVGTYGIIAMGKISDSIREELGREFIFADRK